MYRLNEIEHKYGPKIHILEDHYLNSLLCRLCSPETIQPGVNQLVEMIYTGLIRMVLNNEFPQKKIKTETRMTAAYPDKLYEGQVLDKDQRVAVVNLARAGTLPSYVVYQTLNQMMTPENIRQDHIMAARKTNSEGQVVGTDFGASKIGGDVDGSMVLYPDPMGATGGTLVSALDHYENDVEGTAAKHIALHLIITPEYVQRVTKAKPNLIVYGLRLDRGFSTEKALASPPGTFIAEERGLDERHYIVPGGGGLGEVMNNSFV